MKTIAKRLILVIACACGVMLASTGCESSSDRGTTDINVTMDQYNAIRNGMTYDEVVDLLGFDGVERNNNGVDAMYSWIASTGNIVVYFRNGRVVSKAQSGLQ